MVMIVIAGMEFILFNDAAMNFPFGFSRTSNYLKNYENNIY